MNDATSHPEPEPRAAFNAGHALYRAAWWLIGSLFPLYLRRRVRRGKEDPARMRERYGVPSLARPGGALLWVHSASVGESLSALPLVKHLLEKDPNLHVLITTGTVTSARLLETRLPARALHQFIPLDHPTYAKRFLNHWRPDVVFWMESEFWPNLLGGVARRKIPAALLNARLSDRSFRRWKKWPGFIGPVLETFTLCLAQDESVARKLVALGARHVSAPGNLKFAAPALPDEQGEREALDVMIGQRPLVLAAQTADDEEARLGVIYRHLKHEFESLLFIVVPRHPERGPAIRQNLVAQGLNVAVRSNGDAIADDTDIYLADTMGELGVFFRLDAPVFLGRSLVPGHGGSNPLEPARFGRCIIQGPWTDNFVALNDMFRAASASLIAADENELKDFLRDLLKDPERAHRIGAAGEDVFRSAQGVLERVTDAVTPLLSHIGGPDARP